MRSIDLPAVSGFVCRMALGVVSSSVVCRLRFACDVRLHMIAVPVNVDYFIFILFEN